MRKNPDTSLSKNQENLKSEIATVLLVYEALIRRKPI